MPRPKKPKKDFGGTKNGLKKAGRCLRRAPNLTYYARTRRGGVDLLHCLETKDRQTAENLRDAWLKSLGTSKRGSAIETFHDLLVRFLAARKGLKKKTKVVELHVVDLLNKTFPPGTDISVNKIRCSDLKTWLSDLSGIKDENEKGDENEDEVKVWRKSTFNRYRQVLKQVFDLAIADGIYTKDTSPFQEKEIKRHDKQEVIRLIPTEGEFVKIIAAVRSQKYNAEREKTADFLEFIGRAGLGQAEASQLTRDDIDFEGGEIKVFRKKTSVKFAVPIYEWLRPVLKKALERPANEKQKNRVFVSPVSQSVPGKVGMKGFKVYHL